MLKACLIVLVSLPVQTPSLLRRSVRSMRIAGELNCTPVYERSCSKHEGAECHEAKANGVQGRLKNVNEGLKHGYPPSRRNWTLSYTELRTANVVGAQRVAAFCRGQEDGCTAKAVSSRLSVIPDSGSGYVGHVRTWMAV